MKRNVILLSVLAFIVLANMAVAGVCAAWVYLGAPEDVLEAVANDVAEFRYGTLYITKVQIIGGQYASATATKIGDLDMSADLNLNNNTNSSVNVEITLYNNTDVIYYYDKTEVISQNNQSIAHTVSGIAQKDPVQPKSYKTIQVEFAFIGNNTSNTALATDIRFHFVIDKDSIGDIVALTAVDRFKDVLNNKVAANSYSTLETAMNDRSGFNKASAVTYIGNVYGSSSTDSKVLSGLFGEEFMSMDLDGDGKAERITMMVKREDLDGNSSTGASYTYSNWGRDVTVHGNEMTLYITSQDLSKVSSNANVTVYAAVFTKNPEDKEWKQIVPLTKGTAKANNYSGYGSANSFNTDTWMSIDNKSIETLVSDNQ